jgi:hypothetical protein
MAGTGRRGFPMDVAELLLIDVAELEALGLAEL